MAKIGRNVTCPCGSGKKYKQCCLNSENPEKEIRLRSQGKSELNDMNEKMRRGYELLRNGEEKGACEEWLLFWEGLKGFYIPQMKSITDAEKIFPFDHFLLEWSRDLLRTLDVLCHEEDENSYRTKRQQFARDFCSLFPETEASLMQKMNAAAKEK